MASHCPYRILNLVHKAPWDPVHVWRDLPPSSILITLPGLLWPSLSCLNTSYVLTLGMLPNFRTSASTTCPESFICLSLPSLLPTSSSSPPTSVHSSPFSAACSADIQTLEFGLHPVFDAARKGHSIALAQHLCTYCEQLFSCCKFP